MQDTECVSFLQWALPQLQMRWPGFRKVRKQVCKRLSRRLSELDVADIEAYKQYLASHPDEWKRLDGICRVVVTRFYRDKLFFSKLTDDILPMLASNALKDGRKELRIWSIGSASGEEAYTLAILWQRQLATQFPGLQLSILGTEVDPHLLERSRKACYPAGTVKNLPQELRLAAFTREEEEYCLKRAYQRMVVFKEQDIRTTLPHQVYDLILCRNLVFTYFVEPQHRTILNQLLTRLVPDGWLTVGVRETLPDGVTGLDMVSERLGLYRRSRSS
ncbi:CheR family methyltransferase [Solemya velesiana gill symbiont]|uniref:Chemotaxis protein CheR n=1 Tax=Solemya velesiana gill symbiont TaxID=1918948 RepID=A0A1T2KUN6_9GAMM|nr:CheR family methyltransferase [Solemya velesiana gill symbiont]OOZ36532.1 chemotaxis protein CheR [Solemya velesiana gill symbiont]